MKVIQLLVFCSLFLFSKTVHSEADLKLTASGHVLIWNKDKLNVCLDETTKNIPNIEKYVKLAIDVWKPSKYFPELKINKQQSSCDIFIYYKEFNCCSVVRPLAINTLTHNQVPEITRAVIVINKFYSNEIGDASKSENFYDLPGIIAHELGHAIGLDEDKEDRTSVMFDVNFIGKTNKRELKSGDLSAIKRLYEKYKKQI